MHIHTNHIGSFFQNTATRYIGLHLPLTVANEWKRLGICCIGGCATHNDWQIKESFITFRLPPESDPTRHGFNLEKGTEMAGSAKAEKEKGGMKKTCIPPPPPTLANMYKGEQRGLCTNILASKHLKDQRRTILGNFWDLQNYLRLEQKFWILVSKDKRKSKERR